MSDFLNVKKTFKAFTVIFILALTVTVLSLLAELYLPPNKTTHECQRIPNVPKLVDTDNQTSTKYKQAFCEMGFYPTFKDSWSRTINNASIPTMFVVGVIALATAPVILMRKKQSKK
jgi:hypothetical protein